MTTTDLGWPVAAAFAALAAAACGSPVAAASVPVRLDVSGDRPGPALAPVAASTGERREPLGSSAGDRLAHLVGRYRQSHQILLVDPSAPAGWAPADVEDTLRIERIGAMRFRVSVLLVRTNVHTCELEGIARPEPEEAPTALVYRSDGPDNADVDSNAEPLLPCVVRIVDGKEVTLEVTEEGADGCRSYCGAHATLDGAQFTRP